MLHSLRQKKGKSLASLGVLAKDSKAIILDEPSSNLDAVNEQHLLTLLQEVNAQRLIVVASHRPAVMAACDFVYVMQNGEIILRGTPQSLSADKRYASLMRQEEE